METRIWFNHPTSDFSHSVSKNRMFGCTSSDEIYLYKTLSYKLSICFYFLFDIKNIHIQELNLSMFKVFRLDQEKNFISK